MASIGREILKTANQAAGESSDLVVAFRPGGNTSNLILIPRGQATQQSVDSYEKTAFEGWTNSDYTKITQTITPGAGTVQFSLTVEHNIPPNDSAIFSIAKNGTIVRTLLNNANSTGVIDNEIDQINYQDASNSTDFYEFLYSLSGAGVHDVVVSNLDVLRLY